MSASEYVKFPAWKLSRMGASSKAEMESMAAVSTSPFLEKLLSSSAEMSELDKYFSLLLQEPYILSRKEISVVLQETRSCEVLMSLYSGGLVQLDDVIKRGIEL